MDNDGAGPGTATTDHYIYDRDRIKIAFRGTSTTPRYRFLHGPEIDHLLAEELNGDLRWLLSDHQGMIRDVINNVGTIRNHLRYNSFGTIINQTNGGVSPFFSYTGRELDSESGLYFYRSRYYNPSVGRYIGEDWISLWGEALNLSRTGHTSIVEFACCSMPGTSAFEICLMILLAIGILSLSRDVWKWATRKPDPQKIIHSQKFTAVQKYLKETGAQLRDRHGRQKHYTPAQVKQSILESGCSSAYDCYALALYCSEPDFDAYHQLTGEPCNYQVMRQDICDFFAPFFGGELNFDACDALDLSDRPDFAHAPVHHQEGGWSFSSADWGSGHHHTGHDSADGGSVSSDFGGGDSGGGGDSSGGGD